jgi:leucyl-tRNA synthetase
MAYDFTAIEKKWQRRWLEQKPFAALDPQFARQMPKSYVLDMFPYPSGDGLHAGHGVQKVACDAVSRYLRMRGHNVLFCTGWDAFGLPAEQYAIKTNTPPAVTTKRNTDRFREQTIALGISYDWDREINTSDPDYYRWTQWIFLQIYNSYFDPILNKAMPITHLLNELNNENYLVYPDGSIGQHTPATSLREITGEVTTGRLWRENSFEEQRDVIDGLRLAYTDDVPVNWCPQLGTVLANEEVIDGKSEVGGFPVEKRPMRQWMMRITAFAQRLLQDLDLLQWPDSLKQMQRNWIGKSIGAEVEFTIVPGQGSLAASTAGTDDPPSVEVFTTRPDTLYGATYLVLAPEHPLVDQITAKDQLAAVNNYRQTVAGRSERDRMADAKEKTGAFTGAKAINPVNNQPIPVYIADYVLMTYGTGAIMAVPGHDQRDFEFAKKFGLEIRVVVQPTTGDLPTDRAFEDEGIAVNSGPLDGLPTAKAKQKMIELLEKQQTGIGSTRFKLRDWLFARQRYWGEPFPIVLDEDGNTYAIDESELPLTLPEMSDFRPTGQPQGPLSKAGDWLKPTKPARDFAGNLVPPQKLTRETSTMPQWAGSCWYYLRFCDPHNSKALVDPAKQKYWLPVDLYVGGVEHAVLHLLYSRFWHKVLFDLGHVATPEPFERLVNQGLIIGEVEFRAIKNSSTGKWISLESAPPAIADFLGAQFTGEIEDSIYTIVTLTPDDVEKRGDAFYLKADPTIRVDARSFKMSKSRGNVVNPDSVIAEYGADVFRLYELYMGPLEAQKPWNTRDIIGMSRFLASVHRNFERGIADESLTASPGHAAFERDLNRAIKKITGDIEALRFNTAIAELIKLNNSMNAAELFPTLPRDLAEKFILLLSPFAPHVAEELWHERLGHAKTLAREPWPKWDESKLAESMIELPVQVNGKLRDKITVPADADEQSILATAEASDKLQPWLQGKQVRKRIYVKQKLVSFVVG